VVVVLVVLMTEPMEYLAVMVVVMGAAAEGKVLGQRMAETAVCLAAEAEERVSEVGLRQMEIKAEMAAEAKLGSLVGR
jgi:hypothetical protein